MNLQIDVGNTFLKWRVVGERGVIARGGNATGVANCLAGFDYWDELKTVALASVASVECDSRLISVLKERRPDISPFIATTQAYFNGVACAYELPTQMGVDRWLAIIAGYLKYKASCCIVDCGSAITVDMVGGAGVHEGGYIVPGVRLMRESLTAGTKRVLFDDMGSLGVEGGKSTTECVGRGINFMVFSVIEQLKREQFKKGIKHLFVTGGDAKLVASLCDGVEVVPDLVLDGLELVSCFNGNSN